MPTGLWVVLGWMIFVPLTGVAFLIWGWKNGQFKDIEAAKYRMLEDIEPEPWPDRKGGSIMTQNATVISQEIIWVVLGAIGLFAFALAIALPHRPRVLPGSSGHREQADRTDHEVIRPDGYIDSFSNEIEEAGGSLPPVVQVALPAIILWWLLYLIFNFTQR